MGDLDQDQLATLRLEYQEVCKSHQAIADLRVKLLGLLPLASGASVYTVLGGGKDPIWSFAWVAGTFGFCITLGLFLYELRGLQRSAALARCARGLEAALGLANGQFTVEPRPHLGGAVDASGAAWLVYPTVLAAWVYLIAVQRLGVLWAAVVAAILVVGLSLWLRRRLAAGDDAPGASALAAPAN